MATGTEEGQQDQGIKLEAIFRWNFDADDEGVLVCRTPHDRSESCIPFMERLSPYEVLEILNDLRAMCLELSVLRQQLPIEPSKIEHTCPTQELPENISIDAVGTPKEADLASVTTELTTELTTEHGTPSNFRLAQTSYGLVLQGCFYWDSVNTKTGEKRSGLEWRTLPTVDLT